MLPAIKPAAKGTWTGLTWLKIPAGSVPAVPTEGVNPASGSQVEGWSKGFVDFVWDAHLRTLVPWVSPDGIRWSAGKKINTGVWTAAFAEWDRQAAPADHDMCTVQIMGFYEGPNGLLVDAIAVCGGGCGVSLQIGTLGMWTSPDAVAWTPLDVKQAFGTMEIKSISAASAGFVAFGTTDKKPSLMVSEDARHWTAGAFPAQALLPTSTMNNPAAFAGGYVLPGTVLTRTGQFDPTVAGGGCAYMLEPLVHPALFEGALWLSDDGSTWTRATLPGVIDDARVSMEVVRLSDDLLLATEYAGPASDSSREWARVSWVSSDGKTWTKLGVDVSGSVIAGRNAGLLVKTTDESVTFTTFDQSLHLVPVSQSGDLPDSGYGNWIMGPTGLLASSDGVHYYLGVPTVR